MDPEERGNEDFGSGFRHVESFLEMLSAELGAAAHTLAAQRRGLTGVAAPLAAPGLRGPPG